MYVIIAPIQVRPGHKEEFLQALLDDARGSMNDEPGCVRFDVIQDAADPNRVWLYEAYKDEEAFQSHTRMPHLIKWRETTKDWWDAVPQGAARGSYNIWPPDQEWH